MQWDIRSEGAFLARLRRASEEPLDVSSLSPPFCSFEITNRHSKYKVSLVPDQVCECEDWRRNGYLTPCKHIIFAIVGALKLPDDVCHARDDYVRRVAMAYTRYWEEFQKKEATIAKNDPDCVICYEAIQDEDVKWTCKGCGHRTHNRCFLNWRNSSPTCPFCRKRT